MQDIREVWRAFFFCLGRFKWAILAAVLGQVLVFKSWELAATLLPAGQDMRVLSEVIGYLWLPLYLAVQCGLTWVILRGLLPPRPEDRTRFALGRFLAMAVVFWVAAPHASWLPLSLRFSIWGMVLPNLWVLAANFAAAPIVAALACGNRDFLRWTPRLALRLFIGPFLVWIAVTMASRVIFWLLFPSLGLGGTVSDPWSLAVMLVQALPGSLASILTLTAYVAATAVHAHAVDPGFGRSRADVF